MKKSWRIFDMFFRKKKKEFKPTYYGIFSNLNERKKTLGDWIFDKIFNIALFLFCVVGFLIGLVVFFMLCTLVYDGFFVHRLLVT